MDVTKIFYARVEDINKFDSSSFCAAKWLQETLYLQTGWNHSCHHPAPHKIPLEEIEADYRALHNTKFKKEQMQKMLQGERPSECDYCWRVEDMGNLSDRYYKTAQNWAWDRIPSIMEHRTDNINPSYLEISFSNVCNLKCAYCSPDVSSKWLEEIQSFGPYPTSWNTGDLNYLKKIEKFPYLNREHNPYVEAFWKWWPELSKDLNTLRLTGGEPLLSKDVWDLLEKIENDPNLRPDFTLGINTNLNVPKHLIDKLIAYVKRIAPRIAQVQIYTSNEAVGAQAEYIRYGINYDEWYSNLEEVVTQLPENAFVGVMTTINIFSLSTLDLFIEDIMSLRKKYYKTFTNNQLVLSMNYLRWPPFLHPCLAPDDVKESAYNKLDALIEKYKTNSKEHFGKFFPDDVEKITTISNLLKKHTIPANALVRDQKDFCSFVEEYDKRKGTDFEKTFPELIAFKHYCKNL